MEASQKRFFLGLGGIFWLVVLWSIWQPHDMFTWWLEAAPALLAFALLAATYQRFPLTPLVYILIFSHALILLVGAHYTYAEVPVFNWLQDQFNLSRNYYDRVGHFAQGFVPAMVMRELILRTSTLQRGKWLFTIIIFAALGISGLYEIFEWIVADFSGAAAVDFLGTQGDVWDTQKDMALAITGAMAALLVLGKIHDRQLEKLLK